MDVQGYKGRQETKRKNKGALKVGEISKKVQETRLKWYGHVKRREKHFVAMGMEVQGRRRGRSKKRWLASGVMISERRDYRGESVQASYMEARKSRTEMKGEEEDIESFG